MISIEPGTTLWSRRTPLHRRLGVAGGVLAAAMTVAAMAMTMDLARRSASAPTDAGLAFAILIYDVIVRGRPHSATVCGGAFLIASQYIRVAAGATAGWIAFARMLAQ